MRFKSASVGHCASALANSAEFSNTYHMIGLASCLGMVCTFVSASLLQEQQDLILLLIEQALARVRSFPSGVHCVNAIRWDGGRIDCA
jgi:hypothetical protein